MNYDYNVELLVTVRSTYSVNKRFNNKQISTNSVNSLTSLEGSNLMNLQARSYLG